MGLSYEFIQANGCINVPSAIGGKPAENEWGHLIWGNARRWVWNSWTNPFSALILWLWQLRCEQDHLSAKALDIIQDISALSNSDDVTYREIACSKTYWDRNTTYFSGFWTTSLWWHHLNSSCRGSNYAHTCRIAMILQGFCKWFWHAYLDVITENDVPVVLNIPVYMIFQVGFTLTLNPLFWLQEMQSGEWPKWADKCFSGHHVHWSPETLGSCSLWQGWHRWVLYLAFTARHLKNANTSDICILFFRSVLPRIRRSILSLGLQEICIRNETGCNWKDAWLQWGQNQFTVL